MNEGTPSRPRASRLDVLRDVLAAVVLASTALAFAAVIIWITLDRGAMNDPFLACPDPAGQLYRPGQPRWSSWPPGLYCDYRTTHPEWPDGLAVEDKPPVSRAVVLCVTPPAMALSTIVLWQSARRRCLTRANQTGSTDHATSDP